MKSVSDLLHKTPWWVLLASGVALAIGLAAFVTPVHIIGLQKSGQTPEQRSAIKREVDLTFSEGAIDLARGVVREMRSHAKDPARREELDQALEEIEQARRSLREAGAEVKRARREAGRDVGEAVREASRAITDAQKEAARALERAGIDPKEVNRSMEESLAAARKAEEQPPKAGEQPPKAEGGETAPPAPPPAEPKKKRPRIVVQVPPAPDAPDLPLSPEERAQIREKVTGDLWRIGVGAGLILIFIPLFILAVVSKFFVDRSRAAQRMAELKRKEAEYHRMSQQVTEAKLSALQAQVEPHFLYNTLASVQALTEVDPQRANEMTGHLIQYLRNALPKMRESVSTVGQEVELVRAYLNILQMRMGKRLGFEIDVPAELLEQPFPPLMLPSLVENAIKHGLEPQREGGVVRIHGELADGVLRMVVTDTGRGFGDTVGAGVGLANIRERLATMYGDKAHLKLEAHEPHGVVATIEIPRDGARAAAPASSGAASAASPGAAPAASPGAASAALPGAAPAASPGAASAPPSSPQASMAEARTRTARTLAAMGTAERAWRKGLSFTFVVLVVVAAILAGLGILGVAAGILPVDANGFSLGGATGTMAGMVGIAIAFVVVVLAIAIVLAVVYGLGFLFVGLAIFIPLVIVVSLFPVLAPFLLIGLFIWWLVRRHDRKLDAAARAGAK